MSTETKVSNKYEHLAVGAVLVGLIVVARLLPHPGNFAPVAAVGLLAGHYYRSEWRAILTVWLGMLITDPFLGTGGFAFHMFIYAGLLVPVLIGVQLHRLGKPRLSLRFAAGVFGSALASSITFFIMSNLGTFFFGGLYHLSWGGLVTCYVNAIPFFRNTAAGDLLYSAVLFAIYGNVLAYQANRSLEQRVRA